nr:hypothetical protein [Mycolicibacterium porcinum]
MQFAEPDHTNRSRAEAFGAAAAAYDRYRPRYPRALIAGLLAGGGRGHSMSARAPVSPRHN